jgi:MFS transporter, DHA3 family, macrolide efflux protein
MKNLLTFGGREESLFLYANFISSLGNGIQIIAAAYITLLETKSAISVGTLFILAALPQAVLSVVSGGLADRGHRKLLCIASDLIRAAAVTAIPVAMVIGNSVVPVLYVSTFVVALFDAVFMPVGSSWIQVLTDRKSYARFSARFEISTQVGMLISSALGGFLVVLVSAEAVFLGNAISYVISALILALMKDGRDRTSEPVRAAPDAAVDGDVGTPAPRIAWFQRLPGMMLFAQGKVIPTVMNTLLIVLVVRELHKTMSSLGVIDALAGVGFTAGALLFGRAQRRLGTAAVLIIGYILTSVFILAQPFFGIVTLGVFFIVACFTFGLSRVGVRALLMHDVPDEQAGRVFGAANGIGFVVGAVGTICVSWLVERSSAALGYASVAGYLLLTTVVCGIGLVRDRRPAVAPADEEMSPEPAGP